MLWRPPVSYSRRQLILPAHRRRCDERHFARHVISSVLHASVPRESAATHFHTARPSAAQPRAPPHALSNSEIYIYIYSKKKNHTHREEPEIVPTAQGKQYFYSPTTSTSAPLTEGRVCFNIGRQKVPRRQEEGRVGAPSCKCGEVVRSCCGSTSDDPGGLHREVRGPCLSLTLVAFAGGGGGAVGRIHKTGGGQHGAAIGIISIISTRCDTSQQCRVLMSVYTSCSSCSLHLMSDSQISAISFLSFFLFFLNNNYKMKENNQQFTCY